jgi:hypothetical protein
MHFFHYSALDIGIPTRPVFDSLTAHEVLKLFKYSFPLSVQLAVCALKVSCIASLGESNQRPLRQQSLSLFLVVLDARTLENVYYREYKAVIIIVFGKFL